MPDQHFVSHEACDRIVLPSPFVEQVTLAEISPRDKPWDKHKKNAEIISCYYKKGGMDKYAERVYLCSRFLDFRIVKNKINAQKRLKLYSARFCRVRHCPICQWRRSLMWKAKAYEALPKVITDYPENRWLFLTLTLKNCQLTDLRNTLDHMNKAFKRLTELKAFPGIGWIKSIEITRGRDGKSAHPHIHCLILAKPSYFKSDYLSKQDWISLWQQCLRIDYKPVIDIQAVNPSGSPVGLIAEILKYQCKESDLCADVDWFLEYVHQVHKTRSVSVGGVLRGYFKDLEREPEDLIGNDGESPENGISIQFQWNSRLKQYIMVSNVPCITPIVYDAKYQDTG